MNSMRSRPSHPPSVRRALPLAVALLGLALPALAQIDQLVPIEPRPGTAREPRPLVLELQPAGVDTVRLVHEGDPPDERYHYEVAWRDGRVERLTPDEYAALLYHEFSGRNRWFAFLNITSPIGLAWVALGLLGQVLFTGRMIVQWLTSEREGRSVVPVAFWWMSLGGAAMLVVYFIWRKDVVGVLGQSAGFFVYLRNLWLIYQRDGRQDAAGSVSG